MFEYIVKYNDTAVLIKTKSKTDIQMKALQEIRQHENLDINKTYILECSHQIYNVKYIVTAENAPDSGVLFLRSKEKVNKSIPESVTIISNENCTAEQTTFAQSASNKWPDVVRINSHRFSSGLKHALSSKIELGQSHQRELLSALYELVTSYTFYPTPSQYRQVTMALLQAYPHLGNGLAHCDAVEGWKAKLSNKMRNSRSGRDKEIPVVAATRVRFAKSREGTLASGEKNKNSGKSSPAYGVLHYLCDRPSTEDDASIQSHKEKMKEQSKKRVHDMRLIENLMNITYGDRRSYIVNGCPTVADLLEEYPCMFDSFQVLYEFERLTELKPVEVITIFMNQNAKYLIALSEETVRSPLATIIQNIDDTSPSSELSLPDNLTEEERVKLVHRAIIAIPFLMGEESLIQPANENCSGGAPHLQLLSGDAVHLNAEFQLKTEDIVVCKMQGLLHAAAAWFASFYILNMSYPVVHRKTLIFFQRVIFEIKSNIKTPLRVLEIKKKITVMSSDDVNKKGTIQN